GPMPSPRHSVTAVLMPIGETYFASDWFILTSLVGFVMARSFSAPVCKVKFYFLKPYFYWSLSAHLPAPAAPLLLRGGARQPRARRAPHAHHAGRALAAAE